MPWTSEPQAVGQESSWSRVRESMAPPGSTLARPCTSEAAALVGPAGCEKDVPVSMPHRATGVRSSRPSKGAWEHLEPGAYLVPRPAPPARIVPGSPPLENRPN